MTTGVENVREAATSPSSTGLVQGLGLFDATTIVMGSMIGSAIFIVAAEISREVKSPGMFLVSWILAGAMTVMAALSYGELAAMMPLAGGQYVYLRESLGHLFGFLYGWTLFLVIQTGTIAAVAVAFGKFLGIFFPWVSEAHRDFNSCWTGSIKYLWSAARRDSPERFHYAESGGPVRHRRRGSMVAEHTTCVTHRQCASAELLAGRALGLLHVNNIIRGSGRSFVCGGCVE
jgi:amino acid transporter